MCFVNKNNASGKSLSKKFKRKDHFYNKAKDEGFVARSAYKIEEIEKKYKVFPKKNSVVLDLGCSPGGWVQVLEQALPKDCKILAIDLLPLKIKIKDQIDFIQADLKSPESFNFVKEKSQEKLMLVLSDMAPNLSGIGFRDHLNSIVLCANALVYSLNFGCQGSAIVLKTYPGEELENFKFEAKKYFTQCFSFIPKSTRKSSNEIYLVLKNKISGPEKLIPESLNDFLNL